MSQANRDRTMTTAAVLGGGAALAWYLLGGRGLGGAGTRPAHSAAPPVTSRSPPCRVRIRHRTIELNDAPADLPTTIEACRAAGAAELTATGDAIVGVISETGRALHLAGVRVSTTPDLLPFIPDAIGSAG